MAYVRFSPGSDVFLRGREEDDGKHVIQCWGCLFNFPVGVGYDESMGETTIENWEPAGESPLFDSKSEMITHLQAHMFAGHKVPAQIIEIIKIDTWLT